MTTAVDPTDVEVGNPPRYFYRFGQEVMQLSATDLDLFTSICGSAAGSPPFNREALKDTAVTCAAKFQADKAAIAADHAGRIAADHQRSATEDIPGTGFPVWDKDKIDATLSRFDAAQGNPQTQWGSPGAEHRGITNEEFIALQNRGFRALTIKQLVGAYNN